jgi:hypothetical protein
LHLKKLFSINGLFEGALNSRLRRQNYGPALSP